MTDSPDNNTLDLSDLVENEHKVKLPNGEQYPMLDPRLLSFRERAKIVARIDRMMKTGEKVNKNPDDVEALEALSVQTFDLVKAVLPTAPADQIENLQPYHLDLVSGDFLGRYGSMIRTVGESAKLGAVAAAVTGNLDPEDSTSEN